MIFAVPFEKDDIPISVEYDYSITFTNLARIKNPFSAGIKTIKVSSFVPGDEEDIIEAVVRRTTTVSPPEGARGSEFTLEGKGYAAGTITVYHDADGEEDIDPGETLASVKTARGGFRVKLTAGGEPSEAKYTVWARDSEGEEVPVEFDIRSSMSFEPPIVSLGSRLTIIISDWEENRDEVVAVQIAGEKVFIADAIGYANCIDHPNNPARQDSERRVTLTVDVPSNIPPGEQTVAVFDHSQLDYSMGETDIDDNAENRKPCSKIEARGQPVGPLIQKFRTDDPIAITKATVEIQGQSLTLSPSEAVRGQRVTVSGFGFGRGGDITCVTINGKEVQEDFSRFEISTTGFISLTVPVPLGAREGTNEVRVEGGAETYECSESRMPDIVGTGVLTVPEPAVAVSPSESRAGTEVTVTGTGFIANTPVRVSYVDDRSPGSGDTHVGAGFADARGNVSLPFTVPLSAQIGLSYQVTVQAEVGSTIASASATHSPALSTISTSPAEVSPGDLLTVSGVNLRPFAIVRPIEIDGRNVTPFPAPTTDETGAFEAEVRVPGIPFGDQPLRVEVSGVVLTHTISIVPLPFSGPPERVFRDLVRSGALVAVWRYDNATQDWDLYGPAVPEELSELNDLTHVQTGDILWLETTVTEEFQGDLLNAGWSLISLK